MRRTLRSLPEERPALDGAVGVRALLATPVVEVVAWRCRRDTERSMARRSHDRWVLTVPHHGSTRVECGRWEGIVDAGLLLLHPPGVSYRVRHPFGCGDRGCNFLLAPRVVEEALQARGVHAPPEDSLVVTAPPPSLLLVARLLGEAAATEGAVDPLEVEETVVQVVDSVLRSTSAARGHEEPAPSAPSDRVLADRVREAVARRYAGKLSLDDLARAARASASHTSRVFRRLTGCSVHRYVRRRRLAAAIDRILEGDDALARVARDVGFSSHSHLSTALRQETGVRPAALRRRGWAALPGGTVGTPRGAVGRYTARP